VTARRAALAAAVLSAATARFGTEAMAADGQLRVLIVVDASDDPFAERIKAEVSALGLEVVTVEPWRTGESVESLDAAGRANQAAAAIRMIASRKGVEVWVANQPTGRSLLRQLIVDERPGAPNEGLVALQTAELLRTTLLSRSEVPGTAPAPPPPNKGAADDLTKIAAPPPQPPSPPTISLGAAAGVLFSPSAGDPAVQFWLTVSRIIAGPVGIALDGSLPLRAGTLRGPEGSARLSATLGGAALFARYERPDSGLYAVVAAGGAIIQLKAAGSASDPLVASSGSTTAGALYARGDAGYEAARWLRVGGRAVAGVVPSGVEVRFAGNEAAVWGRPFLAAMALVDLAW